MNHTTNLTFVFRTNFVVLKSNKMIQINKIYINGEFVPAQETDTFDLIDPTTNRRKRSGSQMIQPMD